MTPQRQQALYTALAGCRRTMHLGQSLIALRCISLQLAQDGNIKESVIQIDPFSHLRNLFSYSSIYD